MKPWDVEGWEPKTEAELVEYMVAHGNDRMEAEHVASICFGTNEGCCVEVEEEDL